MGPNRHTQHIISKNTVLVTVTLSCSACLGLLSLFVLYPRDISINAIDLVINALCLSLMKRRWDGCYRRLCKYPDRCINSAFLKIMDHLRLLLGISPVASNASQTTETTNTSNNNDKSHAEDNPNIRLQVERTRESKPESIHSAFPSGLLSITMTAEAILAPIDETGTSSIGLQLNPINEQCPQAKNDKQFFELFGCSFEEAVQRTFDEDNDASKI